MCELEGFYLLDTILLHVGDESPLWQVFMEISVHIQVI